MKRRDFLKTTAAAMAGGAAFAGVLADWANAAETKVLDIRDLLESDNPEVLALAQRVFDKCSRLERFHDWYWRERDLHDIGLITLGAYTGKLQHARWETFDYECNMDGMTMTVHPKRKGLNEGAWYADVCVPGNTAYLILGERSLARLAEIVGDKAMAARRKLRVEKGVKGMREQMWDESAGTFLSVKRNTLEKIPVATIGCWIPLAAGVPTEAMARRMAAVLASPDWQTPLPVPTVDRTDKRWKSDAFWRGDVWPPTNYQIASGLAAYNHKDLSRHAKPKAKPRSTLMPHSSPPP